MKILYTHKEMESCQNTLDSLSSVFESLEKINITESMKTITEGPVKVFVEKDYVSIEVEEEMVLKIYKCYEKLLVIWHPFIMAMKPTIESIRKVISCFNPKVILLFKSSKKKTQELLEDVFDNVF